MPKGIAIVRIAKGVDYCPMMTLTYIGRNTHRPQNRRIALRTKLISLYQRSNLLGVEARNKLVKVSKFVVAVAMLGASDEFD